MSADDKEFPSVWTRPRRGREQPALSQDQIVSEAIALLDAEGIEALSMRKLGTRLDAGATSLYRHVANRDELIELVVDAVYGEIQVPAATDPAAWRESVAVCAHSVRSMILRHPWIASMLGQVGLSYLGPNVASLNNRMLAMFVTAGFVITEADQALTTVVAYVIGISISEAAWLTVLARSGRDEQDWHERLQPSIEQATQSFPQLHEQITAQAGQDVRQAREDNFNYGLDRILDGLEAVPRRSQG